MAHPIKRPVTKAAIRAVDRLRGICLGLPEATEKMAWGEPTWRAGKIFAQMDTYHHGAEHVAVWLPAAFGVQEALVAADPERYFVPPYVGVKGWIGARIDRKPDWTAITGLVVDAYRLVASPRLIAALDAAPKRRRRS
ncbi:MAG TPA: MmcQ/YjbR family DNA-binding protein [Candidatus Binatia bacterium]|nr:MmcQ/YjbR family DNA-binding protein [Candidatus Binatia bacterium]